jgi:hypothetical protein
MEDGSSIKEKIKSYAEKLGVDDTVFASVQNYRNLNSILIKELFLKPELS